MSYLKSLQKLWFVIIPILFFAFAANAQFVTGNVKLPFEPSMAIKNKELLVNFKVDKDTYVYKESLTLNITPIKGLTFGKPNFPKPEKKFDKFLKQEKEVYTKNFVISVPIKESGFSGKTNIVSVVGFQGCSKTICYIPQEKELKVSFEKKK